MELLRSDFAGDHVSGMSTFVRKLNTSLNTRLRRDQPATGFVVLGGGFNQGGITTPGFKLALGEHGLKAFHGDDAGVQPGNPGDLLVARDSSVAGAALIAAHLRGGWNESEQESGARLRAAEALCKEMPQRTHDLVYVTKGDRLNK